MPGNLYRNIKCCQRFYHKCYQKDIVKKVVIRNIIRGDGLHVIRIVAKSVVRSCFSNIISSDISRNAIIFAIASYMSNIIRTVIITKMILEVF